MNWIKNNSIYLTLLLLPLIVMAACSDGNECNKDCEGFACGFGCTEPVERNQLEPDPLTDSIDCPSNEFISKQNREICNEEFCVAIVDEYVECESVDCYSVECYRVE